MNDFINPKLPDNLPIPEDDGACDHLVGRHFPSISFETTEGNVNFADLKETTVLYIYPRSSDDNLDPKGWDAIPGARGCSPQGCAFRDHKAELSELNVRVFGLSTQDKTYLKSEVERLHLPFELVSDDKLQLKETLNLPLLSIKANGISFYNRVTLIINKGVIIKVFYPVFPPDKNAEEVISWLENNPQ